VSDSLEVYALLGI